MESPVSVTQIETDPLENRPVEFVERKGIGHPDTLCDGIAEAVSRALSQQYRTIAGSILHHNTDKVQLVAGRSDPAFGGGSVEEPIYVLVSGRATWTHEGREIPVERIATTATHEYLLDTCQHLTAEDVEIEVRLGTVSADLQAIFNDDTVPHANDTSFGVGFAPQSTLEQVVSAVEPAVRTLEPVGEDVKVMGARRGKSLELTVAAAMIGRYVSGIEAYRDAIETVRAAATDAARRETDHDVTVSVNSADDLDTGTFYLTETGLSAEMGDDGAVGRGNRVNGLITPHRPMSLEAVAGKNPVTHVGKLYNILGTQLSRRLHDEFGADYAEIHLLSQIGAPVTEPQAVDVQTTVSDAEAITAMIADALENIQSVTDDCVAGRLSLF